MQVFKIEYEHVTDYQLQNFLFWWISCSISIFEVIFKKINNKNQFFKMEKIVNNYNYFQVF